MMRWAWMLGGLIVWAIHFLGVYIIASLGDVVGRAFGREEIVGAIDTVLRTYLGLRSGKEERFLDCYRRVGIAPFKEALYGSH